MFENILSQPEAIDQLKKELLSGVFPHSVLFSGPSYAGKLSAALELARVLSCEQRKASWNCICKSCELHRLLLAQNVLLVGGRYFTAEVAACCDAFARIKNLSGRYLYARSIRKVTRRFDPVLWEGEEAKLSKVIPSISRLEELAYELGPGDSELPSAIKFEEALQETVSLVKKVEENITLFSVPVGMIRRINAWAHLKGSEQRKIILIENADRLLDSARNALLKLLEEPPSFVYLVLLTTRRSAIIPTILSRVRTYTFDHRKEKEASEVLERIFKVSPEEEYKDLESYFLLFQGVKQSSLHHSAIQFLRSVTEGKDSFLQDSTVEYTQDRDKFRLFLQELLGVLQSILKGARVPGIENPPTQSQMEEWSIRIRRSVESAEVLNVQPLLLAERLFVRMRRGHA